MREFTCQQIASLSDYPRRRNPCDILRHSYGIIISLLLELARKQSIQHLIRHSIYDLAFDFMAHRSRVYPYSTLYYKPLFTIALQRHPFLFLLHDKSLYEDEHESDTPFLTRDAQELAKEQRMKLETRLETWNLHQQLAVLDEPVLGEAISLGLSQEYTRIEDILGYLVWIGQRSVFLEL